MSKKNQTPETTAPVTTPARVNGNAVNPNSIRQKVRAALIAGQDTAAIGTMLQTDFPGTAAAAKSTKHIAWYRGQLRKEGLLPKRGAEAPVQA